MSLHGKARSRLSDCNPIHSSKSPRLRAGGKNFIGVRRPVLRRARSWIHSWSDVSTQKAGPSLFILLFLAKSELCLVSGTIETSLGDYLSRARSFRKEVGGRRSPFIGARYTRVHARTIFLGFLFWTLRFLFPLFFHFLHTRGASRVCVRVPRRRERAARKNTGKTTGGHADAGGSARTTLRTGKTARTIKHASPHVSARGSRPKS